MDRHDIAIIMPNWIGRKLSEFRKYYNFNYGKFISGIDYCWDYEFDFNKKELETYRYIVLVDGSEEDRLSYDMEDDLVIRYQFYRLSGKIKELKCEKS